MSVLKVRQLLIRCPGSGRVVDREPVIGELSAMRDTMLDDDAFLDDYVELYQEALRSLPRSSIHAFRNLVVRVRSANRKLIFAGNGASALTGSHGALDFLCHAGVRTLDFTGHGLVTALVNDHGHAASLARAIELNADDRDAVVLLSVSGSSPNVVQAAKYARARGLPVVAFTGSALDNPLRQLADIDFWFDSKAYNPVECIHMIWLTMVVDMVVGRREYPVS